MYDADSLLVNAQIEVKNNCNFYFPDEGMVNTETGRNKI